MPFGNDAGQGGNISLSKHIWYNKDRDRIESDVPIATTLSSLYLDRHISLSSGGAAMYFRDHTRNIDAVPCISGLYDQKLISNHGDQGVFGPTGRTYGPQLINVESIGALNVDTEANVAVGVSFIMPFSTSTQGYESVLGEAVAPGDKVVNTIYDGVGLGQADPIPIFQQTVSGLTLAKGDTHMWWYDTPADFLYGDKLHQIVTIVPDGDFKDQRVLLERSAGATGLPWRRAFFRSITDAPLPKTSDIILLETYIRSLHPDTDDINTKNNGLFLLRNGDTATWPGVTS